MLVPLASNVRDQRRRALGAPLADRNRSAPVPVLASGMPTRDDRCIDEMDSSCWRYGIDVPS
jgi:hypothetical protein